MSFWLLVQMRYRLYVHLRFSLQECKGGGDYFPCVCPSKCRVKHHVAGGTLGTMQVGVVAADVKEQTDN